jgi:hypothetical protein
VGCICWGGGAALSEYSPSAIRGKFREAQTGKIDTSLVAGIEEGDTRGAFSGNDRGIVQRNAICYAFLAGGLPLWKRHPNLRQEGNEMAVTSVNVFRVHPGRLNELLENLKTVKKVVERAGGTYSLRRQVYGPQPNSIFAVAQYPDWSGLAKVRSDPEIRQFMDRNRANTNPASEMVTSTILEDVPL